MKNIQKMIRWITPILVIAMAGAAIVNACVTPPDPSHPDVPDPNIGPVTHDTISEPNKIDPNFPNDNGTPGGDPVLLKTGEFLFTRTDAVVSGISMDFPIVRSYRGKPAPLDIGDIGELGGEGGGGGGGQNNYYTKWYTLMWDKPPVYPYFPDSCYSFDAEFQIIRPAPAFGGGYQSKTIEQAYADAGWFFAQSPVPSTKEGIAIRFFRGEGTASYTLRLTYTRTDPTWTWLCHYEIRCLPPPDGQCYYYTVCPSGPEWYCGVPYTEREIYRWEQTITIPGYPDNPNDGYPVTPTEGCCCLSRGQSNILPTPAWNPGWDMSYNIHLAEYPDPNTHDQFDGRTVRLYSGDTNYHTYRPSAETHPIYGEVWSCSKRNDFLKKWGNGTYTLYLKHNELWQFTADGYIQYISKQGNSIHFNYANQTYGLEKTRRLDSIEDAFGRRTNLIYTDSNTTYPGNLWKIRSYNGAQWTYDYYGNGNLKSATDPNGFKETYLYTSEGILEKVVDDANNVWLDNDYDNLGRVETQSVGGREYSIQYNTNGATLTDPNGAETTYVLNSDGYETSRTEETETGTATTLFGRNTQNKLTNITYPECNGYDLAYDTEGNLEEIAAFSSNPNEPNLVVTVTGTNDDWSFLKTITDPRGYTTTYTYDYEEANPVSEDGLLVKITYPQVLTDTGPATPEIRLTYDPNNQLETITSPDGIVLKYEYGRDPNDPNSLGLVKKVVLDYGTDPNCLNIEYNFAYDGTGRVVDVNDPLGNTTTLTYNALDLLTQVEDPLGNITKLLYNADRKVEKVQRKHGSLWQEFDYGYNLMAKLHTITDSLGKTTTLDYDDRYLVNTITDPNAHSTQKRYNARQLVQQLIDAEGGVTQFDYDDNGRLSAVNDAENKVTSYQYDGYGRLEMVTYANDSNELYGYDASGNITSLRNRAGQTITFGYDALNRLTDKTLSLLDPNIVLTYDIAGNIKYITKDSSQMVFSHDRLGRLDSVTDENTKTVGYEYDALGRRTKLIYPGDGNDYITYEYDAASRLEYIKDQNGYAIVHYTYDDLGRATAVSYSRSGASVGSMTYDYENKYDPNDDGLGNRIKQISYGCNPSHSISYTYDNVGNILTTNVGGNYGWAYGYDRIYQVTDANQGSATNRTVDFSYDSVYNRTYWADTLGSVSVSCSDNAVNQYSAVGGTTPTYDDNGNITSGYGGGCMLWYDCENRLTFAMAVGFDYDLLGRRNRRWDSTTTITYVWDGPHIIAEYTNGSLTKKYIYGPGIDAPVAMISVSGQTQTWYYYYADALGSIRLLTNAAGAVVESYTYDPYGMPQVMVAAGNDGNWLTEDVATIGYSALGNPILFTGRWWDSTTKLYYYRFRDYSPQLGRFLQPDPIGYADSMNLYAYCGNNPINWIDPWGLKAGDLYPDKKSAAAAALIDIYPITKSTGLEYGGLIYSTRPFPWTTKYYSYTSPNRGLPTTVNPGTPKGNTVAYYHSHPFVPGYDGENFSGIKGDKDFADYYGIGGHLVTPSGKMKEYNPKSGAVNNMYQNSSLKQSEEECGKK